MSTSEKNSLLNQVGKVLCQAQTASGEMIGIAQVNLSLAPVGTELFVQPKDSRLTLEVLVANENAKHWKDSLSQTNARNKILRVKLARAQDMLRRTNEIIGPGRSQLRPRSSEVERCLDDLMKDITNHLQEIQI